MQKLKELFASIYTKVILVLGAIIGILLYYINLKNKEANALKAKIDLTTTQKEADLIEAEINRKLEQKDLLKKEVDELNKTMLQLNQKRSEISKIEANKTEKEIEDYWNKN